MKGKTEIFFKKKYELTWVNLINPWLRIWDWDNFLGKKKQKQSRS
jgi:hypothetical protein